MNLEYSLVEHKVTDVTPTTNQTRVLLRKTSIESPGLPGLDKFKTEDMVETSAPRGVAPKRGTMKQKTGILLLLDRINSLLPRLLRVISDKTQQTCGVVYRGVLEGIGKNVKRSDSLS